MYVCLEMKTDHCDLSHSTASYLFAGCHIRPLILVVLHEPLDRGQVLPLHLIVHDMSHILRADPLSPCALVDPHHGQTNRPGRVTDGCGQVHLMCLFNMQIMTINGYFYAYV